MLLFLSSMNRTWIFVTFIGQVVYFGPAKEAINYYTSLGFTCRPYVNPADYFMDVVVENERHCAKVIEDGLFSNLPIAVTQA